MNRTIHIVIRCTLQLLRCKSHAVSLLGLFPSLNCRIITWITPLPSTLTRSGFYSSFLRTFFQFLKNKMYRNFQYVFSKSNTKNNPNLVPPCTFSCAPQSSSCELQTRSYAVFWSLCSPPYVLLPRLVPLGFFYHTNWVLTWAEKSDSVLTATSIFHVLPYSIAAVCYFYNGSDKGKSIESQWYRLSSLCESVQPHRLLVKCK